MPEERERGVENNESSSASSTCGDTSISSNSNSNERTTSEPMSGAPTSGHIGESSSSEAPNSAPGASPGDAGGGTANTVNNNNVADTSPTSVQRHRGDNTSFSVTSSPPGGATPEPPNLNATTGEGDGGTNVPSKTTTSTVKKTKDCHEIVKTSAVAGERRGNLCSVHQNGISQPDT
ncbi:hypothetical protein Tcan_18025 [Toxocara canis]|uniref:Uncharacterized protein n=1 Tax=Toxocara canis TaxID=6265 RepID=A0A0B2VKF9_TOXCA|nr:hypothetical protein Tcan_18025 [Toxocara canis]